MIPSRNMANNTRLCVGGLAIKASSEGGPVPIGHWEALLWRALDLCHDAQQPQPAHHADDHHDTHVTALTVLDINLYEDYRYGDVPMIRRIATEYAALTRPLQVLRIAGNAHDEAEDLDALAAFEHLQSLSLSFGDLTSLAGLHGCCAGLLKIDLCGSRHLESLEGLEDHTHLEEVDASLTSVASLRPLRKCHKLKKITLVYCVELTTLDGLQDHTQLQELNVAGSGITSVDGLQGCTGLKKLDLSGCEGLDADVNLLGVEIEY